MREHGHRERDGGSLRPLAVAFAINTAFFAVELAGALYADSLTLLADAVHMLTDSLSLALALVAAWVAARPADARRTYGYRRAEVLGALANGVFLVVAVGYVVFEAVQRFQDPSPVRAGVMVGVGVLGLAANLGAAWVIAGDRENLNVRGAYLHLLADAGGSLAAVVVGLALLVRPVYVLDPVVAVIIAALVLYSVWGLLRDSLNILLQGTPPDVDVDAVAAFLANVEGVREVHDVHVWALTPEERTLSAHVVVGDDTDAAGVLARVQRRVGEAFDVDHATIQIETPTHTETSSFDCYEADAERG